MKNSIFFLLLTATFLSSEEHPWPMWGHDARHTQRTELIGMIPGGHVETIENDAYSPTYCGVSSCRDSLTLFTTGSSIYYYYDDFGDAFSSTFNVTGVFYDNKSTSDFYAAKLQYCYLSAPCFDADTIYFSYPQYKLVIGTIDSSGNFTFLNQLSGPYNGPITKVNKRLYITSRADNGIDIYLTAYDGNDTYEWSIFLGKDAIGSAPAVDTTGQIYVLTPKYLYSINENGFISWINPVNIDFFRVGQRDDRDKITLLSQAPLISQDNMIVVADSSGLMAFNANNGSLIWKFTGRGYSMAAPSELSDGTFIYLTSYGIYAINKNGNEKWHIEYPKPTYMPATIDGEDKIYICTSSPQKGIACISSAGELLGQGFYNKGSSYTLGQAQIINSGEIITGRIRFFSSSGGGYKNHWYIWETKGGFCIFNDEKKGFSKDFSLSYSPPFKISLSCSPNPFRGKLKIDLQSSSDEDLKIYDITGRLLLKKNFAKGKHSYFWKASNSGVFIIKFGKEVKKAVRIE